MAALLGGRKAEKEMNELTKEDWVEIYYALIDKQARIEEDELGEDEVENSGQGDAATWSAHLGAIIDKIGPDGENMTEEFDGTSGQDRQNYTDTQDRESYS